MGNLVKDVTEKWNFFRGTSIIDNITKKIRHVK